MNVFYSHEWDRIFIWNVIECKVELTNGFKVKLSKDNNYLGFFLDRGYEYLGGLNG